MVKLGFKKIDDKAKLPAYAHDGDAGMDVCSVVSHVLTPGERFLFNTGLVADIPDGYELQVRPRSGLALKHGVTVLNGPGTVDSSYTGPIGVILANFGNEDYTIFVGDRIAQLILAPVTTANVCEVEGVRETGRGPGGFGSTGV